MTTVKQAKETIIFVIDKTGFPQQTTLYDWVMSFEDENKLLVEYVDDIDMNEETGSMEDNGKYFIRYNPVNRPSKRLPESFDTEEEAEDECFNRVFNYDFEKSNESTYYFQSEEECEAYIIETLAASENIDNDVAAHIFRKMKTVFEKREIKNAAQQAEWTAEQAKRNAEIERLLPLEVEAIEIDQQFKSALLWAGEATGSEKSTRMASAMKGLLKRNNITDIKSDFWRVFRILKAKAESTCGIYTMDGADRIYPMIKNGVKMYQVLDVYGLKEKATFRELDDAKKYCFSTEL